MNKGELASNSLSDSNPHSVPPPKGEEEAQKEQK